MSLRAVLLVSVIWFGSVRVAAAALTEAPDPLDAGSVAVGQFAQVSGTLSASPVEAITAFELAATADCAQFEVVTPASIAVPYVVGPGGVNDKPVDIRFRPTSNGAKSCVITAKDALDTVLTTFTATGTGVAPAIGVNPTSLAFGSARVALGTITRTLAIGNTGDAASTLTVTNIAFSGAASGDYVLNPPVTFPLLIAAGSSTNVIVEFDPSAAGARAASLDIASDDPVTPTKSVPLSGTGTTAIIAAADVNFGTVNDGTTGSANVAITNTAAVSRGVLTVTSATISGGSGFFTFGATAGCSGGTSCTFTQPFTVTNGTLNAPVRCSPPAAAAGTQTATVTFVSDSDAGGDNVAQLTCTAGRPNIMVSTNLLAFGNVAVNTTSAAQTVTVMNTGSTALTYSVAKNPNAAQYVITGCVAGCSIPALGMATFDVAFSPTVIGDLGIQILITNNDPDPGDNVFTIGVSGTGTAPQIAVAPSSLAFANTEVGQTSAAQLVTATNTGNAQLAISSATLISGGTDFVITSGTTGAQTVDPGLAATWNIACKPGSQGAKSGRFRIASNSLIGGTSDVTLTCTGEQGIVATTPPSLDFGPVAQGVMKQLSFTLRNSGNVTITGLAGVLGNPGIGYVFDAASVPSMLLPGASVMLTATFFPQNGTDGGPTSITFTAHWGASNTTTMAVLGLNGDGLTAGYDVTPPALGFGDFRFDQTPALPYHIINTDQANVTIISAAFTPDTGTASTEFSFVIRKGAAVVTLPQTLAPGEQLDVTVTARPNNRVGMLSGHVDIHSNLAMNPDRTLPITGNSTSAGVSAPMLQDFAAVDIDGPPQMQSIMITNTGTATLDITSVTKMGGASPALAITLPTSATHLTAGMALTIPITYTPTVERPPNQFDSAVLVANLAGVFGGPTQAMITVRGRGIDRHIALDPAPSFPMTFRNPGATAPVRMVTVHNTGEATLKLTAVMLTNDPVWQLLDPDPVAVPGGMTHDFMVKFSPLEIGKAPDGQLTILDDDNGMPMATVVLTGEGIGRNVMFGPARIELGFTGVGIPITAKDIVAITNMDPDATFAIHAMTVTGDPVFEVENTPTDVSIGAATSQTYSLTFTPDEAKHFTARLALYLDADPTEQGTIEVSGDAVFVDAHGSGGCSAGGGAGGGLVLIVALIAMRRRRTALAVVLAVPLVAHADSIGIAVFDPTPATTGTGFQLQTPDVGPEGTWVASTVVSYASHPLVLDAFNGDGQFVNRDALIARSTVLELGGAYAFLGRFEAGASLPFYIQSGDPLGNPQSGFTQTPASGTALGSLTLHGKALLVHDTSVVGTVSVGLAFGFALPTASKGQFTGGDNPEARILALASYAPSFLDGRLSLSANGGPVIRNHAVYANIERKSGLAWGGGASLRVFDPLWLTGEVFGEATFSARKQQMVTGAMPAPTTIAPIEWLAGISYRMQRTITVGIAGGRGLTTGIGAPDLRGVFMLSLVPDAADLVPIHAPEQAGPDVDTDGDGIMDRQDKCPNEAEDKDMFEDEDGCPDLDNDRDGIPDEKDRCPLDPEDKDGFQDDDGCPDKDNDADGIPDERDKCPNEAEDKDGYQDLDGCPDPDNDADGIPDDKDRCPNDPETINGIQDDDGCPDKGDSTIVLSPDRIETLDSIQFTGVKLSKAGFGILGQVAATMRAHTEILRLRITVHVQPTSHPDKDQELSEKRAQVIRDWMVGWGLAATRLEAKGFGGTKPLVPADHRGAAQVNDRVELIIIDKK